MPEMQFVMVSISSAHHRKGDTMKKDWVPTERIVESKKYCYKVQLKDGTVEHGDGMHVNKDRFQKLIGEKYPRVPFDRILVWDPAKESEPFA